LPERPRWLTTWSASTSGSRDEFAGPEATVRQSLRVSVGGSAVRLRFSNPHLYTPFALDRVTIAIAGADPASLATEPLAVTVDGASRVEVHPGRSCWSDPIALTVPSLATLAVSAYAAEPVPVSKHDWANRMSWSTLSAVGDLTGQTSGNGFRPWSTSWAWVDAVDVAGADARGALVALGDSITDGAGSDFATDTRRTDVLAERMVGLGPRDPRRRAVANAGIGGNTVGALGTAWSGVNALSRLERDVLSLSGVSEVVVFEGTNDLHVGVRPERLIADLTRLAERIQEAGARAIIATMVGRRGGHGWDADREANRLEVNAWIRSQDRYDRVFDFEAVLDDADRPGHLHPGFDADGTHPSGSGYRALAESIDLDAFV
jgi:lysophospholipase L1-like esterase